ncbi:hypothetical protein P9695_08785 [Weizmannia sp. CD-2023]|uniref:hypothetical protein n=1 Tax=Heyndrickxia TaxID=2837504 RepID=UPI002E249230|nr:hypothetical protein [Weizmannia sp. CD-2023]MED4899716.1 hypothetical protein [Weizmannia sp. CD-2023]
MKIVVKTPNLAFTGRRYIVDQDVFFQNGQAELEGSELHVAVLKSYGYEVTTQTTDEKKKKASKK